MKTLRILWITHDVFERFHPYVTGKPTTGGSWIAPLFYGIKNLQGVKLGSVTPVINGEAQKKVLEDINYYSIRITKKENNKKMSGSLASKYLWVINDFKPDIIHVHGTENNFGLLRDYVDSHVPIVCSIQGIINPYYEYLKFSIAAINIGKFRTLKNRMGYNGVRAILRKWKKYGFIEREIYRKNIYFVGRTFWDKAQVKGMNPEANYFHGEELLRSPFYTTFWNLKRCERHRIFISSAAYPIKGFHVLLRALALLKDKYPTVKVVAPLSSINMKSSKLKDFLIAEDYNNYLKYEIKRLKLENNIIFLERLTAEEMASQYSKAHVFVLPSFIENSPNSLGESMIIGTPTVVSPVGGITSIVGDNESSLLFPSGDHAALAFQIDRIFSDDNLAEKISQNARGIALQRHDVKQATMQYYNIYSEIIKLHNESLTHTSRA
jgi:glycosyltransferase involved in cell wall biosynthesis